MREPAKGRNVSLEFLKDEPSEHVPARYIYWGKGRSPLVPEARSHIARSPEDDDELLRRARDGDTRARGELVSRYQETILRFCQTYLGGLHDAEDAAQDVMACVATGDRLPDQRFRPWLYRVARNRCLAALRKRRNGRVGAGPVAGESRWTSPRTGPRTAALRNEWYERLHELVDTMPEHHREVLILRYFEDLGRKEIAEILELSESVVKSRLFEARQKLREQLQESRGGA